LNTTRDPSIASILLQARKRLEAAGIADPSTDARFLVSGVLGLSLSDLMLRADDIRSATEAGAVDAAVERRAAGEPVHRILGSREFYGLELTLSADTLEPRPDTEILVDAVLPPLKRIVAKKGSARILDMGTGTGAICLALLSQCAAATGLGSDVSKGALETARRNAENNGLAGRFETIVSDWFTNIEGRFDIIVSNPPYIQSNVIPLLDLEVRKFDPLAALDGGEDGLDAYRSIARGVAAFLADDGMIGVEIGFDQKASVSALFIEQGFSLAAAMCDYGGNDRVLLFSR
jgi:release factor glutamine methyltransferase